MKKLIQQAKEIVAKNLLIDKFLEGCDKNGKRDSPTFDFRKKTCDECPNNVDGKCALCTCPIFLKAASFTNIHWRKDSGKDLPNHTRYTHCPAGKWGDLELTNHYREMDGKEPINV